MFTPVPMSEINLFIQDRDIEPVTVALIRLGALQLETDPQNAPAGNEWSGAANAYASQVSRLGSLLKILGIGPQILPPQEESDVHDDLAWKLRHAPAQPRTGGCKRRRKSAAGGGARLRQSATM